MGERSPWFAAFGERLAAQADLAERYFDASPSDRYEIVSGILAGERCQHGFPDQGEGCVTCEGEA